MKFEISNLKFKALRVGLPLLLVALALFPVRAQLRPELGPRTTPGDSPLGGLPPFGTVSPRRRAPRAPGPVQMGRAGASEPVGEFTFMRTIYRTLSTYGPRWGAAWSTDYPNADDNFSVGLREWAGTNLNVSMRPVQVEIMDEHLFDYPLIYFVEPGHMELNEEEAARLREYVARGGFMFFDDFWGSVEWANVTEQLKKVFPDLEPQELPLTHPIFHSYLDITEAVQVPNIYNAQRGVTSEKDGFVPYYMGIVDKRGRLVAFFSRNSDLGDAWEWINDPRYPVKYGLAAYKVGINVVIYAMSH
ncbi:MAG: DUF4159 domain-containing protein [Acidobacteria bacterium]|nr:DUF4159 domain-containing protein [Acidobacteriota bacterium]